MVEEVGLLGEDETEEAELQAEEEDEREGRRIVTVGISSVCELTVKE